VDLTPHLGAVVGDLADRLTLAGIRIRRMRIIPSDGILLFPVLDGDRAVRVGDACRVHEALAATRITVGEPYSREGLVSVHGTVDLGGQTVTVEIIARTDPEPPAAS